MTDQDLRELLRERVADETMPDVTGQAWRAGRHARRRDRLAVVGGAAVVTAMVTAGVTVLGDDQGPQPAPAPGTPTTTPSVPPSTAPSLPASTTPDGFLGRLPVYFAPTLDEEAALPLMVAAPVPEVIDVRDVARAGDDEIVDRALVAVRTGRRADSAVVVLTDEGEYLAFDTSRLAPAGDAQGNLHDPETPQMLAPDGRHLAFPQSDHLMVLDLDGGSWRRHDLPSAPAPFEFLLWRSDQEVLVFGDDVAARVDVTTGEVTVADPPQWPIPEGLGKRSSYYGFPVLRPADSASAQPWFAGRRVSGEEAPVGTPEVLVVDWGSAPVGGSATVGAAIPDSAAATPGGMRWLGCCPAATWLGPGVPGYLSRGEQVRLLAWHVGTDRFERVTEVVGATGAISFADLSA